MKVLNTEKYQDHIPCSFAYRIFVLMINLLNQLLYIEVKLQLMNLLKQFLKNMNIAKKNNKQTFLQKFDYD